MIHEVAGDILFTKADILAHGVAPNDDFKSGLALALREEFPAMYKDFRHWCKTASPKPGAVWVWAGVDKTGSTVRIAAMLTQEPPKHEGGHPGRASIPNLNHALHELKKVIEHEHFHSVSLPRLATGVGGLEWTDVRPLIDATVGTLPIAVYLYVTYKKGVAAAEPAAKIAPRTR